MTMPDWLVTRSGAIRNGLNASTRLIFLNGHPQYKLVATPATGTFTCVVTQTNNGHRLDDRKTYPNVEAALTGGLQELRDKLGW